MMFISRLHKRTEIPVTYIYKNNALMKENEE